MPDTAVGCRKGNVTPRRTRPYPSPKGWDRYNLGQHPRIHRKEALCPADATDPGLASQPLAIHKPCVQLTVAHRAATAQAAFFIQWVATLLLCRSPSLDSQQETMKKKGIKGIECMGWPRSGCGLGGRRTGMQRGACGKVVDNFPAGRGGRVRK